MSSTALITKCLLIYESANSSSVPSTSCRASPESVVPKYWLLTTFGRSSIIASAHSRLISAVSALVGGTLAGASALSGKRALRIAWSTDGSSAGRVSLALNSDDIILTQTISQPSPASAISTRDCMHMRGRICVSNEKEKRECRRPGCGCGFMRLRELASKVQRMRDQKSCSVI